ncbi:methylmalonyl-CoA mutase [Sorangium cellulosum]|uniref:Methylmalonyl-CoA mutase n=2 Tax=Sorangium cellulosum TaxID=56 RepID=A0A2L0EVC4_SORCE|nr:methylmalonyl-CoA mutase [Sorangium cellulosum]
MRRGRAAEPGALAPGGGSRYRPGALAPGGGSRYRPGCRAAKLAGAGGERGLIAAMSRNDEHEQRDDERARFEARLAEAKKKARPRAGVLAGGPGELARDADDLYDAATLEALGVDPARDLGFPGQPPFTRGVQPNMYRGRLWTMRQYAGFGTAAESNARYHYLLSQGQTGLSVAFDLPTQMGRDSDHERAQGEVGRVGVAIDSLDDMRALLRGLPLDRISTSMTINATAAILLALYIAVAEEQGVPRAKLRGTIQNDILKEYVARGTYIYPPAPSLRLIRDVFAFAEREVPEWNTISISGYHMREAGCDAAQEIAFTLADGIAYVETAVRAGLDVDGFGAQLSFFFNGHNNFLEEVAKFRAARRMWSTIMAERFGAKTERARALRFHCQTAGMTLAAQQPLVNVVRVTVQALAAVLGGCQSLHTNGFDEALGLPTAEAATLALRTQQVIAHESGVADVVDALGGSYAIEALTRRLEDAASAYIRRIDDLGGMVAAIEQGYVQREIQATAYRYQLDIEEKRRVVVGQNEFVSDAAPVPVTRIDPALERDQIARTRAWRAAHEGPARSEALARVDAAARGEANLMPPILDAVRAGATVGEISDVLRAVWGEHQETLTI